MKLAKIDLSNIIAISHDNDLLGLVIDRGTSLDMIEIPAPLAAYEGLQLLNAVVATDAPDSLSGAIDFYQLPGVDEIPMQPVQSSMANAIGYDRQCHVLQVEFKNGAIYQFDQVNEQTWQSLQESESPGRFFNREIRGSSPGRRIG